jgi:hypothetical protein
MRGRERVSARAAVVVTQVSFDAAVAEGLDGEAARLGVTVAEYVHDAALMRAASAVRARGDNPSDLFVQGERTLLDEESRNGGRRAERQSLVDARARRDVRDEAAAVRGESRQVRRRARDLRGETNAILDTVVMMVTDVLRRGGFELLAPVVASFRTTDTGNTGVEVAVRLEDPRQANAAKSAIAKRFPDHLSQVIVT